jgi:hypothetical protein
MLLPMSDDTGSDERRRVCGVVTEEDEGIIHTDKNRIRGGIMTLWFFQY